MEKDEFSLALENKGKTLAQIDVPADQSINFKGEKVQLRATDVNEVVKGALGQKKATPLRKKRSYHENTKSTEEKKIESRERIKMAKIESDERIQMAQIKEKIDAREHEKLMLGIRHAQHDRVMAFRLSEVQFEYDRMEKEMELTKARIKLSQLNRLSRR